MDDMGKVMVGRRSRGRGGRIAAGLAVGALIVIGAAYSLGRATTPAEPEPTPTAASDPVAGAADTAAAFLQAWEDEDWTALQDLIADQSLDAAAVHEQTAEQLGVTGFSFSPDDPVVEGTSATVQFDGTWELDGLPPYTYANELRLKADADAPTGWAVKWWYTTVHPDMTPTTSVERTRRFPKRAAILDAEGRRLVTTDEVVVVGIHPARVSAPGEVRDALARFTTARPGKVRAALRVSGAARDQFQAVAELAPARFDALRPQLFAVDGLVFRREQRRTSRDPSPGAMIGSVGPITAEQLEELGEPYGATDVVGQRGLEKVFEEQLAGEPMVEAAITDDVGLVRSLGFAEGTKPEPVRTTLDLRAQRSAQQALRSAPEPAALVAIDIETGGVRAAAYTPSNGFNRALSGLYAPGSTLKVVTSFAALSDGLTPRSKVACPASIRVADRSISNDGNAAYGTVSFERALAVSCNTTYARLGAKAGPDGLLDAAEAFGFNRDSDFVLPAARAGFPRPDSLAETTRAAIGQARVQASPLHMASIAATAASGSYRAPTLLADDAPEPQEVMSPRIRRHLRQMMRAVVEDGTGRSADLPGEPVYGKTGTAQFDGGVQTHAWFIGFRGDLAFAVVVEGAGHGGAVAAPVARDFLQRLESR